MTAGLVNRKSTPNRLSRRRFRSGRRATAGVALLLTLALTPHSASALGSGPAVRTASIDFPFRDPSLPLAVRVDDLVGRLTLAEKISLLHQYQPAVPRLGLKVWKTGTEALHGVAWSTDYDHGGAVVTSFPASTPIPTTAKIPLKSFIPVDARNSSRPG